MNVVYACQITDIWDRSLDKLLARIPEIEQQQILSYRRDEDRISRLISIFLKKWVLCNVLKVDIEEIEVYRSEFGKPYLSSKIEWKGDFNTTHSGDWVVCAASTNKKVGIDIESIQAIDPELFGNILTPKETQMLQCYTGKKGLYPAFYKLWTLKESFVKAIGSGLSFPINKVEFETVDKDGDVYQAIVFDRQTYKGEKWFCKILQVHENYMSSLCNNSTYPIIEYHSIDLTDLLENISH